jgi:hypothetical protein
LNHASPPMHSGAPLTPAGIKQPARVGSGVAFHKLRMRQLLSGTSGFEVPFCATLVLQRGGGRSMPWRERGVLLCAGQAKWPRRGNGGGTNAVVKFTSLAVLPTLRGVAGISLNFFKIRLGSGHSRCSLPSERQRVQHEKSNLKGAFGHLVLLYTRCFLCTRFLCTRFLCTHSV